MHNVLVTGGAGFIGHHLVRELIALKYEVTILDNFSNSNKRFVHELETNFRSYKNVTLHKQDILNKKVVSDIFKFGEFDTCIHLAARSSVQDSIAKPLETINVNINGTLNVLEACCDNGVDNFLFASSASVYGRPTALPIHESHVTHPLSPYGASKVGAEGLMSYFNSRIKNSVVLRFFNVYGEGQTSAYAGVITKFKERLSNRLPPVIHGDGHQTRDFIHVNDVVRAIILASENKQNAGNIIDELNTINIGTGRPTSVLDLSWLMIDIFGLRGKIKPIFSSPLEGDIFNSYADIRRAKELLNFTALVKLRSGLLKE